MRRPPFRQPAFARLPALPGPGGEAQYLDLDAAPLERARENVGRNRRDRDRPPPHRSRIVDQQGDDRVAEIRVLLDLVGQRMDGIDDYARKPRRDKKPFTLVEIPSTEESRVRKECVCTC